MLSIKLIQQVNQRTLWEKLKIFQLFYDNEKWIYSSLTPFGKITHLLQASSYYHYYYSNIFQNFDIQIFRKKAFYVYCTILLL